VPTRPGPTVQRRRLGIELRRLREQAGKTIDEVAKILECSDSKVSRIENGQVSASPRDVRDMLEFYGVEEERREELVEHTRLARRKGGGRPTATRSLFPWSGWRSRPTGFSRTRQWWSMACCRPRTTPAR
jgi:transcriptional regulator with XRE-family HTH domain